MSTGSIRAGGTAQETAVRLPAVIRSEFIKFTTVRSTWVIYLLTLVVQVGIGIAIVATTRTADLTAMTALDRTWAALTGVMVSSLFVASLGVSVYAGDHTTGMIKWSYIAVPRRLPVLWAKVIMFVAVNAAVMVPGVIMTVYLGAMLMPAGAGPAPLGEAATVRLLAATVGEITAVGLVGLAFGAILRNTASAVTATIGVIIILPLLLTLFGEKVVEAIGPYSWNDVTAAVRETQVGDHHLSGAAALLVLLLYVAVPLAAAAVLLSRRDV